MIIYNHGKIDTVNVNTDIHTYIAPPRAHPLERRVLKSAEAENGGDRLRDCRGGL